MVHCLNMPDHCLNTENPARRRREKKTVQNLKSEWEHVLESQKDMFKFNKNYPKKSRLRRGRIELP